MEEQKKELEETVEEEKVSEPQGAGTGPDLDQLPETPAGSQPEAEGEAEEAEPEVAEQEAEAEQPPADPEVAKAEPKPEIRTFTQEQVNALVGKARQEGREKGYEQARREALERYGVENDDELDDLFASGSRYGELSERYADAGNSLAEVRTELALVKSGVLPERQGDVKAILGANGMEVTVENIESLLPTHPEWKGTPTALPGQTPAPAPQIPQPQAEEESQPKDGDLGPTPKPAGMDAAADEDRERKEALRTFGL